MMWHTLATRALPERNATHDGGQKDDVEDWKEGWNVDLAPTATTAPNVYGVEMPATSVLVTPNPRLSTILKRSIYVTSTTHHAFLDLISILCVGLAC